MALTKISGSVIKDSVSLSGNVSVGGTLTYQDVTNVDALGVGTFRTGINVSGGQLDVGSNIKLGNAGIITATELDISGDIDVDGHTNLDNVSVAGVSTFSGGAGAVTIAANGDIRFGNSGSWSGEHAGKIQYFSNRLYLQGGSNGHQLRNHSGGTVFEIGSTGSCAGMDLTLAQDVTFNGDIDVDGHTNLDNVSIVGVTTFNGLSTNDVIRVRAADTNGISVINILAEGTTGHSRIKFSDTAGTDGQISYTHTDRALTFATAGTTERLRITSGGHISQGGGAEPSSSNGSVAKKFGIKSNANNVIIGETESSGNGSGLHIESRQTGRSGGARIAQIGMKNDASGDGQISFFTAPNGSGVVERMVINSHGLVTRPFQYHLHADRSGTLTGYNAGGSFGTPMIFNRIVSETKDSSLSSCFNTSNGLFTAPVTGVYIFNAAAYSGSGAIFGQSWFTLNGSRCTATDWVINGNYSFIQNFQQIRLAAGNTVGFHPYAAGQNNVTIYENNNHTYFKISLIG